MCQKYKYILLLRDSNSLICLKFPSKIQNRHITIVQEGVLSEKRHAVSRMVLYSINIVFAEDGLGYKNIK